MMEKSMVRSQVASEFSRRMSHLAVRLEKSVHLSKIEQSNREWIPLQIESTHE